MEKKLISNSLLIHADAMQALRHIKDSSIDAVITDPPYFIDGMGEKWSNDSLRKKASKASVVGSMPIGMKFDPEQGRALERFMGEISREIYRVLKPGGFYISFSQGRLYHRMACAIEDAGFEIRDMLVWSREGQAKAFSQEHFVRKMDIPQEEKDEIIASLAGRKTPQLKGQSEPMVLAQKPKDGTFVNNWMKWGVGLVDVTCSLDGKFPGTIMEVPKPRGKERAESKHLTLKPIALLRHLVGLFTKPGDIVLDPFCGSGTCGIACEETGRAFVGIELAEEFYEESSRRIRAHVDGIKEPVDAGEGDGADGSSGSSDTSGARDVISTPFDFARVWQDEDDVSIEEHGTPAPSVP